METYLLKYIYLLVVRCILLKAPWQFWLVLPSFLSPPLCRDFQPWCWSLWSLCWRMCTQSFHCSSSEEILCVRKVQLMTPVQNCPLGNWFLNICDHKTHLSFFFWSLYYAFKKFYLMISMHSIKWMKILKWESLPFVIYNFLIKNSRYYTVWQVS